MIMIIIIIIIMIIMIMMIMIMIIIIIIIITIIIICLCSPVCLSEPSCRMWVGVGKKPDHVLWTPRICRQRMSLYVWKVSRWG